MGDNDHRRCGLINHARRRQGLTARHSAKMPVLHVETVSTTAVEVDHHAQNVAMRDARFPVKACGYASRLF